MPCASGSRSKPDSKQRVLALNRFIDDLYNDQQIIADGVFPGELLENSANFREQCRGFSPPLGIWAHICGSDLVRDGDGKVYVLEDNLRIPVGCVVHGWRIARS